MKLMFCKTIIYSVGLVANKNANSNSERVLILNSIRFCGTNDQED